MKSSMFYRSQDTNWDYQSKSYNNQNIKTVFFKDIKYTSR